MTIVNMGIRSILVIWCMCATVRAAFFNLQYGSSCDSPCHEISLPLNECSTFPVLGFSNSSIIKENGDIEVYSSLPSDTGPACTGLYTIVTLDASGSCNFTQSLQYYTITQSQDPFYELTEVSIGCSSYNNVALFVFIAQFVVVAFVIAIIAYIKCTCTKQPYEAMHTSIELDDDTDY